jgi:hypothetical protein
MMTECGGENHVLVMCKKKMKGKSALTGSEQVFDEGPKPLSAHNESHRSLFFLEKVCHEKPSSSYMP